MSIIARQDETSTFVPLRRVGPSRIVAKAIRPRKRRRPARPRPRPNPRTSWPAWTDQRFTISDVKSSIELDALQLDRADDLSATDAYCPSPQDVPAGPSPVEDAWWTGFTLGIDGEHAGPPEHFTPREAAWFVAGRLSGWQLSDEGQAWFADMAAMRDRPERDPSEAIEALGYSASRTA